MQQYPGKRLALLWDGVTHHRSAQIQSFLESLNHGLPLEQWRITCLRFAPHDPRQNPIEDVWLHAKRWIREYYPLCKLFAVIKWLFEFVLHHQVFDFAKLEMYGSFSCLT